MIRVKQCRWVQSPTGGEIGFTPGDPFARTRLLRDNRRWRCFMGDKGGKKDKEKGQKQHAAKDKQEDKRKLANQPKRSA